MKIKQLQETTAGAVASVAMPMGKTHKRTEEAATPAQQAAIAISMKKAGKKPKDLKEGAMKDLVMDFEYLNDEEFYEKYKKSKVQMQDELKPKYIEKDPSTFNDDDFYAFDPKTKVIKDVWSYKSVGRRHSEYRAEQEGWQVVSGMRAKHLGLLVKRRVQDIVGEGTLSEEELLLAPGQGIKFKTELMPKRTDHEIEMAKNQLRTASGNAKEIYNLIKDVSEVQGLDAWVQAKITKASDYLDAVSNYLDGKKQMIEIQDEVDEVVNSEADLDETKKLSAQEKFKRGLKRAGYDPDAGANRLLNLIARQAEERKEFERKQKEQDAEFYGKNKNVEEDWQKTNRRDKTSGMSRKAVKQYRRENPGSKLQTAVTTKPSKLKKGSKAAKRRKSFCSRMRGMKKSRTSAKTARDPNSNINKALRRWNCESVEELRNLALLAEQKIAMMREEESLEENLRKWFKEKWVRFGPDGKIRGDCARGDDSEGKPKCLPQSKAHSLGKKGRASAAARKRREDPNPERSGPAINVATKKKSNEGVAEGEHPKTWHDVDPKLGKQVDKMSQAEKVSKGFAHSDTLKKKTSFIQKLDAKLQQLGYTPTQEGNVYRWTSPTRQFVEVEPNTEDPNWYGWAEGQVTRSGKLNYGDSGNDSAKDIVAIFKSGGVFRKQGVAEGHEMCPECGGAMYSEEMINEKKDACYYKVKSRYKVWPSAYASGALVKCRKKGAKNWGNKSK